MAATMASTSCMISATPLKSTFTSGQSLQSSTSVPVNQAAFTKKYVGSLAIRASSEEAQPSKSAVLLSGVLGVAAALSVGLSGDALAGQGPGISQQRTAEKADELLKSADALTTNESPPRFGPGRVENDESDTLAQKAGSGADQALQGTQAKVEGGTKDAAGRAQGLFNLFGQAGSKVDDVASKAGDAVDDVKSNLPGQ